METTRSLFPLEPSGWPSFPGRPSASSGAGKRGEELFDREVDRSTERAGGRKAVEEKNNQAHSARRNQRADGFHRHREAAEAERRRAHRHRPSDEASPQHPGRANHLPERPDPPNAGPPNAGGNQSSPPTGGPSHGQPGGGTLDTSGVHVRHPAFRPHPGGTLRHVGHAPGESAAPGGLGGPAGRGGSGGAITPAGSDGHVSGGGPLRRGGARAEGPRHPNEPTRHTAQDPATERAHDVLRQIRLHIAPGLRHATLNLLPAELGRLQVHLQLRDGKLGAEMRVESAETKELLERHVPELRAALARQGLEVESFEFHLGFDGSEGGDARANARSEAPRSAPQRLAPLDDDAGLPLSGLPRTASEHLGGIDTYA